MFTSVVIILPIGMISGAIAAVADFGIGSLLTPILAQQMGTKLAVAAVFMCTRSRTASLRYG